MKPEEINPSDVAAIPAKERIDLARKVGRFLSHTHSEQEHIAAERLASLLARDTALSVRSALAKEVMECPFISKEVAMRIANDVDEVSEVFLLESHSLTDDMMEFLARECEERAREVLAKRDFLPEPVSFAISEVGQATAVSNLMENKTAIVSDRVCDAVTDRFEDNEEVIGKLANRSDLSVASVMKLIDKISSEMAETLMKNYDLGIDAGSYLAGQVNLRAKDEVLKFSSDEEVESHFQSLMDDGLLNDGFILRLIQSENLKHFTIAISIRAKAHVSAVKKVLDTGRKGDFYYLMDKCKVSQGLVQSIYDAYTKVNGDDPKRTA